MSYKSSVSSSRLKSGPYSTLKTKVFTLVLDCFQGRCKAAIGRYRPALACFLLPFIISLSACSNQDKLPATEAQSWKPSQPIDSLRVVDLSGQQLHALPSRLRECKNLRQLHLRKNELRELPPWLGELQKLRWIDLSRNPLKEVPLVLKKLPQLCTLKLARTPIAEWPAFLGQMDSLRYLDGWNSDVKRIHPSLAALEQLEYVDLRRTYLSSQDLEWLQEARPQLKLESTYGCNCGPGK